MKQVYVLLFIISLTFNQYVYGQDGTCTLCLPKGQKCGGLINNGICQGNTVCGPNSLTVGNVTDELSWICRDRVGEGEPCYYKDDENYYDGICELGLTCDAKSSTCVNSRFANIGESCKQQSDCQFINATCTNSICTNNKLSCSYSDECSFGSYCDFNTKECVLKAGEGEKCNSNGCDDNVNSNLYCDETTKTCMKKKIAKLGGQCGKNTHTECDENDNLYCDGKSGVCETYVIPNPSGNCSSTKDSCGVNAQCSCDDGKCFKLGLSPEQTLTIYNAFEECVYENKCSFFGNTFSKSSCIYKNCGSQFCKYLKAEADALDDKCGSKYESYCDVNSNSSLSKFNFSILSILLILIISI